MRIPLPIVIALAVAVVGGVWWHGTRHHDFLQVPPASRLEMARAQAALPPPSMDHPADDAPMPAGTVQPVEPLSEPPASPDNPSTPQTLALYRKETFANAEDLLELSANLETKGKLQYALLAAERVIDSSEPDEDQLRAAIDAIRRLRPQVPNWNAETGVSLSVTLHAGTGKSTAPQLEPLLRELAIGIERASAGILKVTTSIAPGRDIPQTIGPPPVAIWLAGPADGKPSTEVLSFTLDSRETLRVDLADTLLQLLRGYLGRTALLRIPDHEPENTHPPDRLQTHVTRLAWQELGHRLNTPNE